MKSTGKNLVTAFIIMLFIGCTKERLIHQPGNLVPKTVDQDASLPSLSINGARLHAEAFGHPDSTIIVVIHGGPGGDYRSLLNAKELADEGYRVVFYDQRGSGLSQRFNRKFYTNLGLEALDLMYDDLTGIIQHYRKSNSQKVVLFGHSWGAILATAYAGKYPQTISGLIVAEPGGLKWNDISGYIKESRSFDVLGELMNDAAYMDQFITGRENQHEILDYKMSLLASRNDITGEFNTAPGSFWRSGAVIMDVFMEIGKTYKPDFSEGINQFTVPALLFYSEKNRVYPQSWAQRISAAYAQVQLVKVNGTGHEGIFSDMNVWRNQTMPAVVDYVRSL